MIQTLFLLQWKVFFSVKLDRKKTLLTWKYTYNSHSIVNKPKLPVCNQTLSVVSSMCAYWSLGSRSASTSTVFMRKTSKTTVASHTRALSCVCTLMELIFDKRGHVHKLTLRSFTVHFWELPSWFSTTSQPPRPSFCHEVGADAAPGPGPAGWSNHQCLL